MTWVLGRGNGAVEAIEDFQCTQLPHPKRQISWLGKTLAKIERREGVLPTLSGGQGQKEPDESSRGRPNGTNPSPIPRPTATHTPPN